MCLIHIEALRTVTCENNEFYYRPQRSCGQGYVFTRVCDSVHRGGGSPCQVRGGLQAGAPPGPGRENPPPCGPGRENPPPDLAGRKPPQTRQTPPGPGRENPPDLAGRTPPNPPPPPRTRQSPPGPGRENPPSPGPGRPPLPGRRLQHTVNERPVRILLECILVRFSF